jgi:hypothetical protein
MINTVVNQFVRGAKTQIDKVIEQIGVESQERWAGGLRGHWGKPVDLLNVVNRPCLQWRAERVGRLDGNETVVRSLPFSKGGMQSLNGPEDVFGRRVARHAEARNSQRLRRVHVECASRFAGQVEEPLVIYTKRFQHTVDTARVNLREIGQSRAQMGRANRRHAQYKFSPRGVGQQSTSVKPTHTVADQVNRFVREGCSYLLAQTFSPLDNPCYQLNLRHQNAVPRSSQEFGNSLEIRGQRDRSNPDPRETEQPMGQNNWRIQARARCHCQFVASQESRPQINAANTSQSQCFQCFLESRRHDCQNTSAQPPDWPP